MDQSSNPSAGSASQSVGNMSASDLAGVIAQAVAAAVGTAVVQSFSEVTAKLEQISNSVNSQSVNENRSVDTELSGAYDVYANMQRVDAGRDRVMAYAELALANAVELAKGVGLRSLDHFGSLPPVSAKVSGC